MPKTNSPDSPIGSDTTHWPDRICLVRHYPYVVNDAYLEFERIIDAKFWYPLSETEKARVAELETRFVRKKHFEELGQSVRERLEKILDSQEKPAYLCYEEKGTAREIETAKDLIRKFKIPPERVIAIDMPECYRQNGGEYFGRYRERINAILVSLSKRGEPIGTVAIVWRRSDAAAFLWYPPQNGVDVRDARNALESQAILSLELGGNPPYTGIAAFDLMLHASKRLNARQAKKAVCRGLIKVNGETVDDPYFPLRAGDMATFWEREYEIFMGADGIPGINRFFRGL